MNARQDQICSLNNRDSLRTIKEVLTRPVAFYVGFAAIGGGANEGLMLSQAWYWTTRGGKPDGYFWKTAREWQGETGLTRREQETARRNLRERNLIQEKKSGRPYRLFFRVNIDAVAIALQDWQASSQEEIVFIEEIAERDTSESAVLMHTKTSHHNVQNGDSVAAQTSALMHKSALLNQETTPENTAENSTEIRAETTLGRAIRARGANGRVESLKVDDSNLYWNSATNQETELLLDFLENESRARNLKTFSDRTVQIRALNYLLEKYEPESLKYVLRDLFDSHSGRVSWKTVANQIHSYSRVNRRSKFLAAAADPF